MNMSAALLYSARLAIWGSALSLSRVPRRKISPAGARNREGGFRLDPDLVRGAGRQIVAQAGAEEGGGVRDHELALGAEAVKRDVDFLGLGRGERTVAQPHDHALDPSVARRGIQAQHHIHHGGTARG
jgi:hypothetical protein